MAWCAEYADVTMTGRKYPRWRGLARAHKTETVLAENESVTLAGYLIPSAVTNTLTLTFRESGAQ